MTDPRDHTDPPIARLAGVIERNGEHSACSLVFVLETDAGVTRQINYGLLMDALEFAQEQAIIPPLSAHWWARIGDRNGCSL